MILPPDFRVAQQTSNQRQETGSGFSFSGTSEEDSVALLRWKMPQAESG